MIIITSLMIILNIISWISSGFSDFYAEYIFHALSGLITPLTGAVPFSLGEVMIIIGIAMIVIGLPLVAVLVIARRESRRKTLRMSGLIYGWVLIFILFSETMNCFIMYHTTEFSDKYNGGAGSEGFTAEQLTKLCIETIENANFLAEQVNRDAQGNMILPENMDDLAEEAMLNIADDYSMLRGKYPKAKRIISSVLMTQFELQGIYFPFSLEANYNSQLCPARVPSTVCHELSHLKGYIREDEAGFLAYRACIASDSPEMQYSGYISAMNYLFSAVRSNTDSETTARIYSMISDKVRADNKFVSDEYRQYIEEKAVISSETAAKVSDKAMETTLKLNGISDGKKSYSRMVDLLLEYYYCVLPAA